MEITRVGSMSAFEGGPKIPYRVRSAPIGSARVSENWEPIEPTLPGLDEASQKTIVNQENPLRVLIVGGGLSGGLVVDELKQWAREKGVALRVTVVDAGGNFYRGNAYHGKDLFLFNNNFPTVGRRMGGLSLDEYRRADGSETGLSPSREETGDYLELALSQPSDHVVTVELAGHVHSVTPREDGSGLEATLSIPGIEGETKLPFDATVLCMGHVQRERLIDGGCGAYPYFDTVNDLTQESLKNVPLSAEDRILVIGARLSAIDYVRRVQSICRARDLQYSEFPEIHIVSSELLPHHVRGDPLGALGEAPEESEPTLYKKLIESLVFDMWDGYARAGQDGLRSSVASSFLSKHFEELKQCSIQDRRTILGILTWIEATPGGGRASELFELLHSRKIVFIPGRVSPNESRESDHLFLESSDDGVVLKSPYDKVALCPTFVCDARAYALPYDPLVASPLKTQLANEGLLRLPESRLYREYTLPDKSRRAGLFAFGPGVGFGWDSHYPEIAEPLVEGVTQHVQPLFDFLLRQLAARCVHTKRES